MAKISYFLTYGGLPIGAELGETGLLKGLIDYENLFGDQPRWVTPAGTLGIFNEHDIPEIPPLECVSPSGYNIIRLSVLRANTHMNRTGLPWGMELHPETGIFSGKIEDLLDPLAQPFVDTEVPVWITPSQQLASKGEAEPLDIPVEAAAVDGKAMSHYFVVKGYLPWGLELLRDTGHIVGTTFQGVYSGDADDETTTPKIPPRWVTPRGTMGNRNESDSFSYQLEATPETGHTVVKYWIPKGTLPWGLTLESTTGLISGNLGLVNDPLEPWYLLPGGPVWAMPLLSDVPLAEPTVTIQKDQPIDVTLQLAPIEGRTITATVPCKDSIFPWGTYFDASTNKIIGTVRLKEGGALTYRVRFKSTDNTGAFTYQTITINVMP